MTRRVGGWLLGLALAIPGAIAAQPAEILSADRVVAGMKGYGLSDFGDGKGVQRFDVEILGTVKRFAPGQDMILARVAGAGLEKSGIIAGMSGSPIYVDNKLVGALAYGWPFAKDPICGITPIQSMLDIRKAPPAPPVPIAGAAVSTASLISSFRDGKFTAGLDALLSPFRPAAADAMAPLPLPLSFSVAGTPSGLAERFAAAMGAMAVPTGGSARPPGASPAPTRLEPGSAIATVLLTGDMDIAATGTVTWVEGSSVLAFGHPFLSMGPVDMPMADAEVLTVLPSVFRSFKFAATGSVLGSISQDRSSGILGSFGTHANMVPIRVRLSSDDIPTQTFHFEVVHNAMLTPILAAMAIDNVLTTIEKRTGERTLVWKSSISTPDRVIPWQTVFTGLAAREEAVASLALLTNYLMANEFQDLTITGLDVDIRHSDRLQSARIVNVEADRGKVRPGETVPVRVDLVDFRGSTRRVPLEVHIPENTPAGPVNVFIGDGASATAYDLALYPPDPRSLSQVLDFLARVRPPNSLNLLADRRAVGAVVGGEPLAALPPSVGAVLLDRGPGGSGAPDLSSARLESQSVEQPVPVTGSVHLRLEVQPRIF
ncbi:MAG TPA: SpoIVB peptidase S55 domain-containing protein [Thermoanaerobaculia bacterium]|nr:SpoIVB peptidase S55 domain-containing protein [Thermoanaerobaculia bacterium]